MSVLAKADWDSLEALWRRERPKPDYEMLRAPDTGLVMLRGRMGGSGAPFNLGEATVTRCSVRLRGNIYGHAYVMGRNGAHAEVAAIYDALLQVPEHRDRIRAEVLAPLMQDQAERKRQTVSKSAATKVDFFTMVRGED